MSETIPTVVAMTADQAVSRYIRMRDKIAEVKKRQSNEMAPYTDALKQLESVLLLTLQNNKAESMRVEEGTFFRTVSTSARVSDWRATLAFIREREAWELLEARVSKLAVEAIMQDTNEPVPGVEVAREMRINVRRS